MEKVKIADASVDQVRRFARVDLGLEIHENANKQGIVGKMREAGYSLDFVFIDAQAEPPTPSGANLRPGGPRQIRPRIRVENGEEVRVLDPETKEPQSEVCLQVHTQDKPGGEEPVFISVNGRGMWVPRGETVWIPTSYAHVLENAKEEVYEPYNGEGNGGLRPPREVQSYPFSYI